MGQLRQQHGVPALPHALHRRGRGLFHPVFQPVRQPVQHLHPAHHRGHREVYPLRQPQFAEFHAPAVRRDRGGGHHPGRALDQAHDPHHHPHPEVVHHQRLPAALHDLPA